MCAPDVDAGRDNHGHVSCYLYVGGSVSRGSRTMSRAVVPYMCHMAITRGRDRNGGVDHCGLHISVHIL